MYDDKYRLACYLQKELEMEKKAFCQDKLLICKRAFTVLFI